ncbi:MAG: TonB-dependent receptor [Bacteroidota bacterium]
MKTILLNTAVIFSMLAQQVSVITGSVVSAEDGSPVVGASVFIVNTTMGTSTDGDGLFRIAKVPAGRRTIQFSAVGFKTIRIVLTEDSVQQLSVRLVPSIIQTQTVVVTANKRAQSLEEVPASVSTIDAKMFEHRNIDALDDALRYVPGVHFQQSQINIRASSGYSRGVGSRVSLLFDGMPLLSGDTGEITFESIPVFQIDRVEVVKGAGSTLYGSGAMGGVINVLTKEPESTPTAYWKLFTGIYSPPAYDQWKWTDHYRMTNGQSAGFTSRFGDVGVVLSMSRTSDDGYRESDWIRRYNGYLKVKADLSPYQSITYTSNFYYHYRADFLWWKDFQNALLPADNQRDVTVRSLRFNNSLQYTQFVSDELYFDVKAIHFRGNWYRDGLMNTRLDQSISDAAVVDVQGNLSSIDRNMITFGIAGNYERVNANIFGVHEGRGGALYVQDEFMFSEDISATVGIRHDLQEVIGSYTDQQTNPKAGMRYTAAEGHTVHLSIGRGYRNPSIGELFTSTSNTGSAVVIVPSSGLKPEHSWSYEIGSTHQISDNFQLTAALFHNDYYNLIEPNVFLDAADSIPKVNFKNITEARIQGFETGMTAEMFQRSLRMDVHYNYNWAVDRITGSFLRFRPRHIASVSAMVENDPFSFGADYRYISRIEEIDDKLVDLAPIKNGGERVAISIVDVRFLAALNDYGIPFRATITIHNLLGYNYAELIGNISPPRHIVFAIEGVIR